MVQDAEKQKFAEELIAYSETFLTEVYGNFKGDIEKHAGKILEHFCFELYYVFFCNFLTGR